MSGRRGYGSVSPADKTGYLMKQQLLARDEQQAKEREQLERKVNGLPSEVDVLRNDMLDILRFVQRLNGRVDMLESFIMADEEVVEDQSATNQERT